ncbi:crystal protein-like [Clavelina lepadiformis]|uniref:Carboxylic ester hydrolase n=1 Tax=Clavelina lepadiformis TaxID=159417 RepID=A0ABP0GVA5_CLALP
MGHQKVYIAAVIGVILCAAITIPLVITLPKPDRLDLVTATVNEGNIVGQVTPEAGIFFGIPFSQPPIREFRWRRPRDPLKYESRYWDATYKRPGCQQICDQPASEYSCPHEISEDCLYLNVWVPRRLLTNAKSDDIVTSEHYALQNDYLPGGQSAPLAVMVWFYGGNFLNGAGSCVLYDGRNMANMGDVIVVTTNYRVAHLGFLVQGEKGSEEAKGNFGFWDQIKTLEWVKQNIQNFGGDPNKVTIFGQSAGAESVGIHFTSEVSKDLFRQGIMQSNPFGLPLRNWTDAKEFGGRFAEAAGCQRDDMTCLRAKSVKELEKAFNDTSLEVTDPSRITLIFQPWSPVIDGDVLREQPVDAFIKGNVHNKPMINGATVDEGMIFVAEAFPNPMTNMFYKALLRIVFKEDYSPVYSTYPDECYGDCREMVNKLATEYLFSCPQRKAQNSTRNIQHWWYIFNQTWSFEEVWEEPLCFDRVCHAAELAYLFNVEQMTTFTFTEEERVFSKRLIWYWTNFAKYGNPNGPPATIRAKDIVKTSVIEDGGQVGAKAWSTFGEYGTPENDYKALQLQANGDFEMRQPYKDICDFWDNVDAYADHYMTAQLQRYWRKKFKQMWRHV